MKDVRRLYVNTVAGEALGYLDLATLAVFPESADTEVTLRSALRALSPDDDGGPVPAPALSPDPAPSAPQAAPAPHGWEDLADTPPAFRLAGLEETSVQNRRRR